MKILGRILWVSDISMMLGVLVYGWYWLNDMNGYIFLGVGTFVLMAIAMRLLRKVIGKWTNKKSILKT